MDCHDGVMADRILREESKQTQKSDPVADLEAVVQARSVEAQTEYVRSLGKPAERAVAALQSAGIPVSRLLPSEVVSFEHRADGGFILKLARELVVHIGAQALLLGTTVTGIIGQRELRQLSGLRVSGPGGSAGAAGRVHRLTVMGAEVSLKSDESAVGDQRLRTQGLSDAR